MANTKDMTPNEVGRSDKKMMDKLEKIQNERDFRKDAREFYLKNRAEALDKERKKDYEVFGSRGDAARKGMEEGRMDEMGTAYKKGGSVKSSASSRGDGIAQRGKTKGRMV